MERPLIVLQGDCLSLFEPLTNSTVTRSKSQNSLATSDSNIFTSSTVPLSLSREEIHLRAERWRNVADIMLCISNTNSKNQQPTTTVAVQLTNQTVDEVVSTNNHRAIIVMSMARSNIHGNNNNSQWWSPPPTAPSVVQFGPLHLSKNLMAIHVIQQSPQHLPQLLPCHIDSIDWFLARQVRKGAAFESPTPSLPRTGTVVFMCDINDNNDDNEDEEEEEKNEDSHNNRTLKDDISIPTGATSVGRITRSSSRGGGRLQRTDSASSLSRSASLTRSSSHAKRTPSRLTARSRSRSGGNNSSGNGNGETKRQRPLILLDMHAVFTKVSAALVWPELNFKIVHDKSNTREQNATWSAEVVAYINRWSLVADIVWAWNTNKACFAHDLGLYQFHTLEASYWQSTDPKCFLAAACDGGGHFENISNRMVIAIDCSWNTRSMQNSSMGWTGGSSFAANNIVKVVAPKSDFGLTPTELAMVDSLLSSGLSDALTGLGAAGNRQQPHIQQPSLSSRTESDGSTTASMFAKLCRLDSFVMYNNKSNNNNNTKNTQNGQATTQILQRCPSKDEVFPTATNMSRRRLLSPSKTSPPIIFVDIASVIHTPGDCRWSETKMACIDDNVIVCWSPLVAARVLEWSRKSEIVWTTSMPNSELANPEILSQLLGLRELPVLDMTGVAEMIDSDETTLAEDTSNESLPQRSVVFINSLAHCSTPAKRNLNNSNNNHRKSQDNSSPSDSSSVATARLATISNVQGGFRYRCNPSAFLNVDTNLNYGIVDVQVEAVDSFLDPHGHGVGLGTGLRSGTRDKSNAKKEGRESEGGSGGGKILNWIEGRCKRLRTVVKGAV